jgi:GNAT superfamily N-acetyltransferase
MVTSLYEHQFRLGNYPRIKEGGGKLWLDQLRPLLGSYANLYCGGTDQAQAFLSIRVKTYPAYLDQSPRAFIGECYVEDNFRGTGIGKALYQMALEWCQQKGLGSIELQTTMGNDEAEGFWKHLRFQKELTQWKLNL